MSKILINCDCLPSVNDSYWQIENHAQRGMLSWDKEEYSNPRYFNRFFDSESFKQKRLNGVDVYREFESKITMNACMFDFFMVNQDQIPDYLEGVNVFFLGTVYRSNESHIQPNKLAVRYMCKTSNAQKWEGGYSFLELPWNWSDGVLLQSG
jgi:hypothetical protein